MLELIALKKEVFEQVKEELKYIGILFLLVLIIFKIAFFKEEIIVLLRNVLSLFWLFALPGYSIMLYWKEKLGFLERFVIGIVLSTAIIGISSYYLGLIGLNIKYHTIVLPLVLILIGTAINLRNSKI
ncbi:hypothetical protein CMO94_01660 [Candidatus Woesearchaeota archaeon]|jgi:uncharacterized membrane protein|nr:hypothetical protein [Candidatus Woesearchaeota archaeon]